MMKEQLVRLVGGSLKKATSRQVCIDSLAAISGNFAVKQRVIEITIGDLTKLHLKRAKLKIERTDKREKIGGYYRRAHGNIRIVGQFLKDINDRRPG